MVVFIADKYKSRGKFKLKNYIKLYTSSVFAG
jgi:hypothetical protein